MPSKYDENAKAKAVQLVREHRDDYETEELQIVVDSHEQYAHRFATQQVTTVKRALPCGDYGIVVDGQLVASVERKSLVDLVASLTGGKLRYQVGELAALPRAAVVIENRYSQLFKLDRVRPAMVADGLAELQIRWPNVPVVFCETRQLAEEWTYRLLAAANAWATTEHAAMQRISPIRIDIAHLDHAPAAPTPSTAEVRAWAGCTGLPIPDRGRLRPEIALLGTTPTRRTEPNVYGRVLRSPPDREPQPVTLLNPLSLLSRLSASGRARDGSAHLGSSRAVARSQNRPITFPCR